MANHTPTPWKFHTNEPRIIFGEVPDRGQQTKPGIVAYLETVSADWEANRDHIIRAVNNHDALIAALDVLMEDAGQFDSDEDKDSGAWYCRYCGMETTYIIDKHPRCQNAKCGIVLARAALKAAKEGA